MDYATYLVHHGIKGQKWGVRRYQNPDGTLTAAGRKRYMSNAEKLAKDYDSAYERRLRANAEFNIYMHKPAKNRSISKTERLWAKAKTASKKEDKARAKAADFFKKELKDLSSKGLDDDTLNRFSSLGEKILERSDLRDQYNAGDESAFWKELAAQLEYQDKLEKRSR